MKTTGSACFSRAANANHPNVGIQSHQPGKGWSLRGHQVFKHLLFSVEHSGHSLTTHSREPTRPSSREAPTARPGGPQTADTAARRLAFPRPSPAPHLLPSPGPGGASCRAPAAPPRPPPTSRLRPSARGRGRRRSKAGGYHSRPGALPPLPRTAGEAGALPQRGRSSPSPSPPGLPRTCALPASCRAPAGGASRGEEAAGCRGGGGGGERRKGSGDAGCPSCPSAARRQQEAPRPPGTTTKGGGGDSEGRNLRPPAGSAAPGTSRLQRAGIAPGRPAWVPSGTAVHDDGSAVEVLLPFKSQV